MTTKTILVVEEDVRTLSVIEDTFSEAGASYIVCTGIDEAWSTFNANTNISCILIRLKADAIDGRDLCRRIRAFRAAESLPILMIVAEDQLELAEGAIEAGATDVLIDPFEPRELRMRTNVYPSSRKNRVDEVHQFAVAESKPSTKKVLSEELAYTSQSVPGVVAPRFDPQLQRFTYGASEAQIAAWKDDESVTKTVLDKILVCPCCSGVPTFRPGCGTCGSAMTEHDVLIHHYACAHVGAEAEFQKGPELACPKCRQKNLVAGSDFEAVTGGYVCIDCHSRISQPELIGHCLSCQHRFPASEAVTMPLTAFHLHRVRETLDREPDKKPPVERFRKASCAN